MNTCGYLEQEEKAAIHYMLEEKDGKVILSSKNAAKVFAMMANTPRYKTAARTRDKRSSAYWFDQWKTNGTLSENELFTLLKRLNAENSTRVSDSDLAVIKNNIIRQRYKLITDLKNADYALIDIITQDCEKIPFSFATKFCHYACLYMFDGAARDNFPIFDDIIRTHLGKYSEDWNTKRDDDSNRKLIRNQTPKELAQTAGGLGRFYRFYVDVISDLAEKHQISKTGVEQLIWFYHNGD